MTTPSIVDPASVLTQALGDASPDLMRTLLQTMINTLLSAEADAVCGAEYGKPSADRMNSRNGYRTRELDTRVGTVDIAIPKRRQPFNGEVLLFELLLRRRDTFRCTTQHRGRFLDSYVVPVTGA